MVNIKYLISNFQEAIAKVKWNFQDDNIEENRFENEPLTLQNLSLGKPIAKGANAVVYTAQVETGKNKNVTDERKQIEAINTNYSIASYPFALKMMFNYDIQSNATAILKAMYRETVPARMYHYGKIGISDWEIK